MEEVIGRHQMEGDDGKTYTVVEIEEYIAVDTKSGRDHIPGMRRLELTNGRHVIMLDGRPTIRGTNIHLTGGPFA